MLLANFPTGCLVANARSSPRSHRAPVQGLIEPATVPRRWNVNTELGHAAADLVDQVVAAGTIGIVGETHCNRGLFANFDEVRAGRWHVRSLAGAKLEAVR